MLQSGNRESGGGVDVGIEKNTVVPLFSNVPQAKCEDLNPVTYSTRM